MDIRRKLNNISSKLSDNQKDEIEIVNQLMFLMFGRDSEELPKNFTLECLMDQEKLRTFLYEDLCLDVKRVELNYGSIQFGKPRFEIELN